MSAKPTEQMNRPGRRLRRDPPQDRLTRRLLLQLGAVLVILALWTGLCHGMPERAAQWKETLGQLLTQSADLGDACRQLGEDLAGGEAPLDALEDWCVQVFLPADLPLPDPAEEEGSG